MNDIELGRLFVAIIMFILGALWGSFANVLILRIPDEKDFVFSRSQCQSCKNKIPWFNNIPLISWLILRGKCARCGAGFSFRYFVVELLTATVFVLMYLKLGFSWTLLEYLIFAFGLIVVSFIDFDHMILPDSFTLSGIVVGLFGAWLNPERNFLEACLGVIVGGGFLWAIAYVYFALRKEEGMGGGDIKLLAWIGAVLGWGSIPFVILSSSLVGSLVGFAVMARTKGGLKTIIPFGPYLALAALLYIFAGKELGQWYLHLFIPSLSPVN